MITHGLEPRGLYARITREDAGMSQHLLPPLREGIAALEQRIVHGDALAATVSAWPVGAHISHCALVHAVVLKRLLAPTPFDPGLLPAGERALAVLTSGTLPRGIAKAPASVLPSGTDAASLTEALAGARALLQRVESELPRLMADRSLLRHALFGGLDRKQFLRLLDVHQRHHLEIINDILAASSTR